MANNEYNNKVVLADGTVLIDLTADTVDAAHLLSGYTAHGASGAPITGTCDFDSNTSNDTLTVAEALIGKTFHARGTAYTGTMPNNGGVSGTIATVAGEYVVPQGYHDGSGTVSISPAEQAKIIAGNIKGGVQILGVTGDYTGEAITAQTKDATPTFSAQTIQPDTGYDYLSAVNIAPIAVVYTDNAAGGKTVTIGTV